MRSWGDNKESWDAAEFKSWGEEHPISLRINWRGPDSFLAAPMVLDLARLIMEPTSSVPGLQKHLGFFFKRPLGMEGSLLSESWLKLVGNYGS